MKIMTNILSLAAQRQLSQTSRAFNRALTRLASGNRINSARDDAAGLAIATGLEAQRRGMLQAVRNINDARGFLATADGALETQTQLVQRMRELSMQSANGTYSDKDRAYLDTELQTLLEEFNRITNQTQFNGVNLLDGSFGTRALQVSTQKGHTIDLSLASMQTSLVFTTTTTTADTLTTVGTGTFQARTTIATGTGPYSVISVDLNGDGKLDLITADYNANTASIALGNAFGKGSKEKKRSHSAKSDFFADGPHVVTEYKIWFEDLLNSDVFIVGNPLPGQGLFFIRTFSYAPF